MSWTDGLNDVSNAASTIISSLGQAGVFGVPAQQAAITATAQQAAVGRPAPVDWSTILLVAGVGVLVLAILLSRTAPGG